MQGRLDGENAIKDGEGFIYQKLDEWRDEPTVRGQFPKVGDYVRHHVTAQNKAHKEERRHYQEPAETQEFIY